MCDNNIPMTEERKLEIYSNPIIAPSSVDKSKTLNILAKEIISGGLVPVDVEKFGPNSCLTDTLKEVRRRTISGKLDRKKLLETLEISEEVMVKYETKGIPAEAGLNLFIKLGVPMTYVDIKNNVLQQRSVPFHVPRFILQVDRDTNHVTLFTWKDSKYGAEKIKELYFRKAAIDVSKLGGPDQFIDEQLFWLTKMLKVKKWVIRMDQARSVVTSGLVDWSGSFQNRVESLERVFNLLYRSGWNK